MNTDYDNNCLLHDRMSVPLRTIADSTDHKVTITAIGVVGPSWAWRHGVRDLVAARYPNAPLTMYAASAPPNTAIPTARGHLVILDGTMGRAATVNWIRFWKRSEPAPHAIVLDVANDEDTIFSYIAGGIAGYTLLGGDDTTVVAALDDLQHGVAHCSPEVVARLFATVASTRTALAPVPSLTAREIEVLHHLAGDRSNQEIADLLMVELCTVKHHVHNILRKLNVRHRWEAARLAVSQGWLENEG